jgi:hypothetical protein
VHWRLVRLRTPRRRGQRPPRLAGGRRRFSASHPGLGPFGVGIFCSGRAAPSYSARRLASAGLQPAAATIINSALHMGRFVPTPALWKAIPSYRPCGPSFESVQNATSFSFISWAFAFRAGAYASILFSGPIGHPTGVKLGLTQWAGSSEI